MSKRSLPADAAPRVFDLQGHRGARGLWPENTLPGFRAAIALGVTSIELDVVLTQDEVPVVFHDLALNPHLVRGRDGHFLAAPGPAIASLTAAELTAYDVGRLQPGSRTLKRFPQQSAIDGTPIPTLASVCALTAGTGVQLDIELKTDPAWPDTAPALAAIVDAVLGATTTIPDTARFRSFDWRVLRRLRALRPEAAIAWLTPLLPRARVTRVVAEVAHGGWPAWSPVWAPHHRLLRKKDIVAAHAAGLLVKPWTVNSPRRMAQLAAWGVDGLCTDRPDVARAVISQASGAF
jgi:glycerophosphoryl diester phosphodiesterase